MNVVSIIEDTIKNHPRIDFNNSPGVITEHWAVCPCGFSTKHYKTPKSASKAFEAHVAEEVNEMLIEQKLLKLNKEQEELDKKRRSVIPKDRFAYA